MNDCFYPDWESFAYKYRGREQEALEDLARILLRKELGVKQGLFQRVNHKGNETDVIEKDGKVIGFQAKYFDKGIDANNIIHSMRGAKESNPNQTHYYIYCNHAFGNPRRGKNSKETDPIPDKTRGEERIVKTAQELGLTLVWKLNKAILDEVVAEKWIYDVFFNVNGKLENLVKDEERHTSVAFNSIGYSCRFNGKEFHVKRDGIINKIADQAPSSIFVIHGDGGCGKTAVLHEFFDRFGEDVPICYRKATALNKKTLAEVFHQGDTYSFTEFKEAFADCDRKFFIIDSAEHLDEIEDDTIVPSLIRGLLDDYWCVVFTVRNVFVGDLLNYLTYGFSKTKIEKNEVGSLTDGELHAISQLYGLQLPKDQTMVDRIKNLFYLNLYAQYYDEIDQQASDSAFLKLVWEKKIRGKNNRDGFMRENEFEAFVSDRMKTNLFFLPAEHYTSKEFYSLVEDEIIAFDSANGYFITHDIFEEWGMYRIVDKLWKTTDGLTSFLKNLGDTRSIRRTFRLWLKDRLCENPETIQTIPQAAFAGNMPGLWKDEVMCALLLTNKPSYYFSQYENRILMNIDGFADKIIWALRVGCLYVKRVFGYKNYFIPSYAAIGSGWKYIIDLLFENQKNIGFAKWLPVLLDWTKGNHRGETTRKAGLMTIFYYQSEAYGRDRYRDENKKLVQEILNHCVWEIRDELTALLKRCINEETLCDDLPEFILRENIGAMNIHWAMPQQVIELCLYYWRRHEAEDDDDEMFRYRSGFDRNGFGMDENGVAFKYFPPGADQTPLTTLLVANERLAVDFIIRLMNECVDTYAQSQYKNSLVKVELTDGKEKHNWQWHSNTLWGMYRELGSPLAPYSLMSVHMALERYLLSLSKEKKFAECKAIMQRLLFECHSSSVSAVVGSLVLAYPDEFWQEALVLFRVIEFIQIDGQRAMMENRTGSLYSVSEGLNSQVTKERMETTKQTFRKSHLEKICLDYQCFGSNQLTAEENETLIHHIYGILDEHRKLLDKIEGEERNLLEILLSRMDRRRLKVKGQQKVKEGVVILFDTELDEEARKMSEKAEAEQREICKYLGLFNWAYAKMHSDPSPNNVYDEHFDKAFDDACALEGKLANGRESFLTDINTIPWVAACLLKFYRTDLSEKHINWCKEAIEKKLATFNVGFDVMDGTAACIHVLPILMELFPEEKRKYSDWMFKLLLVPCYGQTRISDYVIHSANTFSLWDKDSRLMKELLTKYIQSFSQDVLEPRHLRIIFGLIPPNPDRDTEAIAVNYIKQIPKILQDNNGTIGMFDVLDVLSSMLLNTQSMEIINCLPYTQAIVKENHLGNSFLSQLILKEDHINKPDRFWEIWNSYRSLVPELTGRWGHDQLRAYTLNTQWKEEAKEWHSLRPQDIEFFEYLAEHCEGSAVVLEGLVKILTTIGSNYKNEGMGWLAKVINNYPSMNLAGTAVLFYLELVMLQYIYANKMQIRKNAMLLSEVRTILNFMVAKSSVTGYMLRDMVN